MSTRRRCLPTLLKRFLWNLVCSVLCFHIRCLIQFTNFRNKSTWIRFTRIITTSNFFHSRARLLILRCIRNFILCSDRRRNVRIAIFFPTISIFPWNGRKFRRGIFHFYFVPRVEVDGDRGLFLIFLRGT